MVPRQILLLAPDAPDNHFGGTGVQIKKTLEALAKNYPSDYFFHLVGQSSGPNWTSLKIDLTLQYSLNFISVIYWSHCIQSAVEACSVVFDLVLVVNCEFAQLGTYLARKYKVPLLTMVNFLYCLKKCQSLEERSCIEQAMIFESRAVMVVSKYLQKQFLPHVAEKIHVVYNGCTAIDIPLEKIPKSPVWNVLFMGRLSYEKGFDIALAAARSNHWPANARLHIVFQTKGCTLELYQQLQQLQQQQQLSDSIVLCPFESTEQGKWNLLQRADVVLFPSRDEPFGLVALEAQMAGIPLLATTSGALGEILPQDTFVAMQPTPESLLQGLHQIMTTDEGTMKQMRTLAQANAQKFTWDETARQFHNVILNTCP